LGNEVGVVNYDGPLIDVIIELKSGTLFKTGDFVKFSGFFKKGKISENECLSGAGFDALNSNPELDGSDFAFTLTNISIY
ncbi:hypothetical protein N9I04_05595, partial [Alphaproteobacteria bacterium]|nr:hypothetical protein [Alphaproteobacteria bacterium]